MTARLKIPPRKSAALLGPRFGAVVDVSRAISLMHPAASPVEFSTFRRGRDETEGPFVRVLT